MRHKWALKYTPSKGASMLLTLNPFKTRKLAREYIKERFPISTPATIEAVKIKVTYTEVT